MKPANYPQSSIARLGCLHYLFIMSMPVIYIWLKAPFIRLLIPLVAGILLQWHGGLRPEWLWGLLSVSVISMVSFFFFGLFRRYRLAFVNGLAITALFISIGGLLVWYKNIQHNQNWFGNKYRSGSSLVISLLESPVEKTKSYKANATVDFIIKHDSVTPCEGKIILYFKKDSIISKLKYGSRIVINKPLQEIKNSGNPGGFDYKRYSLFQGITHQVYLRASGSADKKTEFEILEDENKSRFTEFILSGRKKVLNILRKYIKGEKERGLAEALLIGYKDDLDKSLVQSYSNTGVVHVIAISGLHLGLIYWLLLQLFRPLEKRKTARWLRPVLIIAGLWLFSLLAGAQASVIRSAVMFTCIVLGESMGRKTSIYNTLAFSATILLLYNPFWLWDVGFQLSYVAVLSIVIFMQPIYNWFYIKNRLLDFIWKLNAVTLAAQILTVPVGIYHFHQFPASFLLTNFLAVPLSSLILIGEILLCAVSLIPVVAVFLGNILFWLIKLMNTYVERIEQIPFSLWDELQISILQSMLLLIVAAGGGYFLMEKSKTGFKYGLIALLGFLILRSYSFIKANNQKRLIVYNVPQKQAMDFIDGRNYLFVGDSDLLADDFIRNFHIKPSRVLHRIEPANLLTGYAREGNLIFYNNKKIMLLDESTRFNKTNKILPLDLLVISGNPKLYFSQFIKSFSVKQVAFDGKCPSWKIKYWKKDCDSLHIPNHDVSEKGAFVMKL
jgi:competence protein ComEC